MAMSLILHVYCIIKQRNVCYCVLGNATRRCMPDGQWYISPHTNDTWTNYTQCMRPRPHQTVPQLITVRVICHLPWNLKQTKLWEGVCVMNSAAKRFSYNCNGQFSSYIIADDIWIPVYLRITPNPAFYCYLQQIWNTMWATSVA